MLHKWYWPVLAALAFAPAYVGGEPRGSWGGLPIRPTEGGQQAASKAAPDLSQVKTQIIAATNGFRRQEGRGELKVNTELAKAAQAYAEFMARTDKFSHTADDKEPWERADDAGYRYCIVTENIAYEESSTGLTTDQLATKFVEGWKKSPSHRKNLLDADVFDIGVGVSQSSKSGKYYAVQDFGRPRSKEIKFRITNRTDATVAYTLEGKKYSIEPGYTLTHRLCRPSELKFDGTTTPASKELRPSSGSQYVIRKDSNGKFKVGTE